MPPRVHCTCSLPDSLAWASSGSAPDSLPDSYTASEILMGVTAPLRQGRGLELRGGWQHAETLKDVRSKFMA